MLGVQVVVIWGAERNIDQPPYDIRVHEILDRLYEQDRLPHRSGRADDPLSAATILETRQEQGSFAHSAQQKLGLVSMRGPWKRQGALISSSMVLQVIKRMQRLSKSRFASRYVAAIGFHTL